MPTLSTTVKIYYKMVIRNNKLFSYQQKNQYFLHKVFQFACNLSYLSFYFVFKLITWICWKQFGKFPFLKTFVKTCRTILDFTRWFFTQLCFNVLFIKVWNDRQTTSSKVDNLFLHTFWPLFMERIVTRYLIFRHFSSVSVALGNFQISK